MTPPTTMKAFNLTSHNDGFVAKADISTLKFNPAQAVPEPTDSQVLVKIHAVCISPNELTWPLPPPASTYSDSEDLQPGEQVLRAFDKELQNISQANPLRIPCHDIAGTIISSPESSSFSSGDRVFGLLDFWNEQGGMAEYAVTDPKWLAKIPDGVDFVDAASFPRVALTIWQVIKEHGLTAEPGAKILVTGATGAVGRVAIQVLRGFVGPSGSIIALGGKGSEDLKALGADTVIDYRQTSDWEATLGVLDYVFDCVGRDTLVKSIPLIKDNGRIVTIGSPPPDWETVKGWKIAQERGITGEFFIVAPNGEQLSQVADLVASGKLKASVGFVVDELTDKGVRDGWVRGLKGQVTGSVVVKTS